MNQPQYLTIIHPDGAKQKVPLQNKAIKIGRAAGNDIVLPDDKVSQWHCTIIPNEGGYWEIRDGVSNSGSYRCSTNGTFLKRNNKTIDVRESSNYIESLNDDDEIQIMQIKGWRIIFKDLLGTKKEIINTTKDTTTTDIPKEPIQDGYVLCLSQRRLYLFEQGKRDEGISLTPNQFKLIMGLSQRNRDCGKHVLCTLEEAIWFVWGDNYHGSADIPSYVSDLRKKIGFDSIETVTGKGIVLRIDIAYED